MIRLIKVDIFQENGYNAGGAGYVLSRAAMRIFVERLFTNSTACPWGKFEDVQLGKCLSNVGILPTDTRDLDGRQRFYTFRPDQLYFNAIADSEKWIDGPIITVNTLNIGFF